MSSLKKKKKKKKTEKEKVNADFQIHTIDKEGSYLFREGTRRNREKLFSQS